jgi:hypothetical protein
VVENDDFQGGGGDGLVRRLGGWWDTIVRRWIDRQ